MYCNNVFSFNNFIRPYSWLKRGILSRTMDSQPPLNIMVLRLTSTTEFPSRRKDCPIMPSCSIGKSILLLQICRYVCRNLFRNLPLLLKLNGLFLWDPWHSSDFVSAVAASFDDVNADTGVCQKSNRFIKYACNKFGCSSSVHSIHLILRIYRWPCYVQNFAKIWAVARKMVWSIESIISYRVRCRYYKPVGPVYWSIDASIIDPS